MKIKCDRNINVKAVTCAYYAQRDEADRVASSNMMTT